MGSFYTQTLVVTPDAAGCAETMKALRRTSIIIPAHHGICVVCDREAEQQDIAVLDSVSLTLSARLDTACVGLLNHDDDWLVLRYFDRGRALGGLQVGLSPLSLRGSVRTLRALLRPSASLLALYAAFLKPCVFQVHRHARIAEVLDLPRRSVGHGYQYIAARDFGVPFELSDIIEV